ncbi:hypothetical protein SteCoe_10790 [Stentor coeruleus]|uniref:Uncharacterized protein n=1 Tax=Stentor coeruleus TaxID=5963 RepID=A0A1R2CEL9_9CILI|nr:hypothetical protein SteCoe_10790 [Stentor coeruleus]
MAYWPSGSLRDSSNSDFDIFLRSGPKFQDFLTHPLTLDELPSCKNYLSQNVQKQDISCLISYITIMPLETDTNERKYKLPYLSSKILSEDYPDILDIINEDQELLDSLLKYLKQSNPLNQLLTSYFTNLCTSLLSRDKQLLKMIFSTDLSFILTHFANRSLLELYQCLIKKSLKSKNMKAKGQILLSQVIENLQSPELCKNAQNVLGEIIFEDEVYNEITEKIPEIFRNLNGKNEDVLTCSLKVIKSILEKEKDLKKIDEDEWGKEEIIENLCLNIGTFKRILVSNFENTLPTSMGGFINPAGEKKLVIFEILSISVETNKNSLYKKLEEEDLLNVLIEVFEMHPWNSFLHNIFVQFCIVVMQSSLASSFSDKVLRIIKKYCLNTEFAYNKCLGLVAYCWKIGENLVEKAKNDEDIAKVLGNDDKWEEIKGRINWKAQFEEKYGNQAISGQGNGPVNTNVQEVVMTGMC